MALALLAAACGPAQQLTLEASVAEVSAGTETETETDERPALPAEPPPPPGLAAVDYFEVEQTPPPPIAALLEVPVCPAGADGLAGWMSEALEPFGGSDEQPFEALRLGEVIDIAPVLRDSNPACTIAVRQGDAHGWELRDADGAVLGRGVASERLWGAFPRVFQRQTELGGVNFGQAPLASREHVAGVFRGDLLELEVTHQRSGWAALYIVEIPGHGQAPDGMAGQHAADALVGRLSSSRLGEPSFSWPLPLPRALPPGYARCAGPYLTDGFQTEATELCTAAGDVIVVRTDNNGANPVPDPPVRTEVAEVGDRIHLSILTPVQDVLIDAPASLGRDLVEAMATTVPLADRRVWLPAHGRNDEFKGAFSAAWLEEAFADAGARDIEVTEAEWGCELMREDGCPPPDPLPYEVRMRDGLGRRIEAYADALSYEQEPIGPAASATRAYTVDTTDLLVDDGTRTAMAECGGVTFRLRPADFSTAKPTDHDRAEPSIALLSAVLEHLGC